MNDPFLQFMDTYVPSCGIEEAFRSWLIKDESRHVPFVIPDIESFRDTSGKVIAGRREWREHLASTGTFEMGHADLKTLTERHQKAKLVYRERMANATKAAPPQSIPRNAKPVEPSSAAQRVMERLHGRPTPDRPTIIKIAMEERMRKK